MADRQVAQRDQRGQPIAGTDDEVRRFILCEAAGLRMMAGPTGSRNLLNESDEILRKIVECPDLERMPISVQREYAGMVGTGILEDFAKEHSLRTNSKILEIMTMHPDTVRAFEESLSEISAEYMETTFADMARVAETGSKGGQLWSAEPPGKRLEDLVEWVRKITPWLSSKDMVKVLPVMEKLFERHNASASQPGLVYHMPRRLKDRAKAAELGTPPRPLDIADLLDLYVHQGFVTHAGRQADLTPVTRSIYAAQYLGPAIGSDKIDTTAPESPLAIVMEMFSTSTALLARADFFDKASNQQCDDLMKGLGKVAGSCHCVEMDRKKALALIQRMKSAVKARDEYIWVPQEERLKRDLDGKAMLHLLGGGKDLREPTMSHAATGMSKNSQYMVDKAMKPQQAAQDREERAGGRDMSKKLRMQEAAQKRQAKADRAEGVTPLSDGEDDSDTSGMSDLGRELMAPAKTKARPKAPPKPRQAPQPKGKKVIEKQPARTPAAKPKQKPGGKKLSKAAVASGDDGDEDSSDAIEMRPASKKTKKPTEDQQMTNLADFPRVRPPTFNPDPKDSLHQNFKPNAPYTPIEKTLVKKGPTGRLIHNRPWDKKRPPFSVEEQQRIKNVANHLPESQMGPQGTKIPLRAIVAAIINPPQSWFWPEDEKYPESGKYVRGKTLGWVSKTYLWRRWPEIFMDRGWVKKTTGLERVNPADLGIPAWLWAKHLDERIGENRWIDPALWGDDNRPLTRIQHHSIKGHDTQTGKFTTKPAKDAHPYDAAMHGWVGTQTSNLNALAISVAASTPKNHELGVNRVSGKDRKGWSTAKVNIKSHKEALTVQANANRAAQGAWKAKDEALKELKQVEKQNKKLRKGIRGVLGKFRDLTLTLEKSFIAPGVVKMPRRYVRIIDDAMPESLPFYDPDEAALYSDGVDEDEVLGEDGMTVNQRGSQEPDDGDEDGDEDEPGEDEELEEDEEDEDHQSELPARQPSRLPPQRRPQPSATKKSTVMSGGLPDPATVPEQQPQDPPQLQGEEASAGTIPSQPKASTKALQGQFGKAISEDRGKRLGPPAPARKRTAPSLEEGKQRGIQPPGPKSAGLIGQQRYRDAQQPFQMDDSDEEGRSIQPPGPKSAGLIGQLHRPDVEMTDVTEAPTSSNGATETTEVQASTTGQETASSPPQQI